MSTSVLDTAQAAADGFFMSIKEVAKHLVPVTNAIPPKPIIEYENIRLP